MISFVYQIPTSKAGSLFYVRFELKQKHAIRQEFLRQNDHQHCGQLLSFDK